MRTVKDISILDMSGFENLPRNGFEQLCINSANERMQMFLTEAMFVQEETDYISEGIVVSPAEFQNNDEIVDFLFERSLSDLMNKMSDAKPWFVRCIKPNEKQVPDKLQTDLIVDQLKCNGLLEIARIRKNGYALRLTAEEFLQRYRDISFERKEVIQSTFDNCEKVLLDAKITGYAFGKQKVRLCEL
ncbi:uncharacterized protein LOC127733452 [Mytilus californianus]|uniref:uncharacterized protein LOC127733452 n=1 Tax=Mytilus californianus TaxID=6549 RepID=UPI0022478A7F|nr:uncharacterized protein LOC127733452 [Mytilus californianus]